MKLKNLFALLLAVMMLAALFGGCANTPAVDNGVEQKEAEEADKGEKVNEPDDKKEENEGPVEIAPMEITYMGCETNSWPYTLEEGIAKGLATYDYYNEKMLEEQNLVCKVDIVDNSAYKTTLAGYLAGNTLPDVFLSKDNLEADTLKNAAANGYFASIPDIIEHSDGTFANLVNDDGCYNYLKAWCIFPDGGWYYLALANDCKTGINFDHDDVDYLDIYPVLSWYPLNIRVDWLRKCGLSMPTTAQEFTDALVAFQENDANGNGSRDERAFLGIGMANEEVFSHSTAGWFGLPSANFRMNSVTGKIENPVDFGDQYLAFVDYTADLYNKGVALTGEGTVWGYGTNVSGDYCAAHVMYPDNLLQAPTGDPDAQYEPLPIIAALDGVKTRMRGQPTILSANSGISFRSDLDLDVAGAYVDWLYGRTLCLLLTYGIEDKAYRINDDGSFYRFVVGVDFTAEEEESYGDMWCYAPNALFPQVQAKVAWDLIGGEHESLDAALEAGEPYTWAGLTFDEWKAKFAETNWDEISPLERFLGYLKDYGPENIEFDMGTNLTTMGTDEEIEIIGTYGTDLKTYLAEMTNSYIIGTKSTESYKDDLAFAYDSLHMQEYVNALQAQVDRFLVEMGREPILG